jgi:hypothetical protein
MATTVTISRFNKAILADCRTQRRKLIRQYNSLNKKEKTYQNSYNYRELRELANEIKSFESEIIRISGKPSKTPFYEY